MRRHRDLAVAAGADVVEFRLDYLAPTGSDLAEVLMLIEDCPVESIATCRPSWEGGLFTGREYHRLSILHQCAAAGATWIDVERAVSPDDRPDGQVILSHHDFTGPPTQLGPIVAEMDRSDAAVNKIAFAVTQPADALPALDVLRACDKPTVALAMGEAGLLTRILARKCGAFGTFATLAAGDESAPGQPTLAELRMGYRWDAIGPDTPLLGVIGCPVGHSMSPAIHNAALAATGTDGVYLPLLVPEGYDPFARLLDGLRDRPWLHTRGLSVTIPHKEHALRYVGEDACDPLAVRIGAVNTITFEPDGSCRGDNTDYAAAIDALAAAMGIERAGFAGRPVAVLGAGGAARAIVAALRHYGADVTIYNRTVARAEALAEQFGARAAGIGAAERCEAEIIVNCTPLGMHPRVDETPLKRIGGSTRVVFDTIYNPVRTKLLELASRAGCTTVTGVDMFVGQAIAQFNRWMDVPAPHEVMRQVVLDRLGAGE